MASPITAVFNSEGGGIGRHPDCFLALPDPMRHLSRQHAQINWRGDGYLIKNTTGNNFVVVNGHTLHANEFCVLEQGHQIYIGHYLLEVSALDVSAVPAPAAPETSQVPQASTPGAMPDQIAQKSREERFFDVAGPDAFDASENVSSASLRPAETVAAAAAHDDFLSPSFGQPGTHSPAHSSAPFSDNPFDILSAKDDTSLPADPLINPADLNLAQIEPQRRADAHANPFALPSLDARNAADPLRDRAGDVSLRGLLRQPKNIDDLYSDSTPSLPGLDPLADIEPAGAMTPFETHKSLDPLALFGTDSGTVNSLLDLAPSTVMDDHADQLVMHLDLPRAMLAPEENAGQSSSSECVAMEAVSEPAVVVPTPPEQVQQAQVQTPAAPQPAPVPQPTAAPATQAQAPMQGRRAADAVPMTHDEHQLLIQAFLDSAGVPKEMVPQRLTPEFMATVGAMLFTAMQGTVDLIAARAATKREVKAEMTLILPVQNNPLKFVPDGKAALIHMFGKQIPGFLGPIDAMRDAYQDLRAHQVGVFAGMRAALAEVLQRFSPADVEKRLDQLSMIDNLMPSHRKAKLWDLYGQQFKKIYAEAEEDFDVIFGDAFAVAYEEQTKSMREDAASARN